MASADSGSAEESGGDSGGPGVPTPVRSAFETAPVFEPSVAVGSSGQVHVPWQLPDNIGTFVIRVYAVASGSKFGAADAVQLARQPVSLIPSIPRVARVGDAFSCGVTVTATNASFLREITVSAGVDSGGLSMTSAAEQMVTLSGTAPMEVTFEFQADTLVPATLVFSLSAGTSADALSSELLILPVQQPVFVGTSMGITASESPVPWVEGIALPEASPGSGSLDLLVGVGYLPAVRTISASLISISCTTTSWCSVRRPTICDASVYFISSVEFVQNSCRLTEMTNCGFFQGHSLANSLAAMPSLGHYLDSPDVLLLAGQTAFDTNLLQLQEFTDSDGLRYSRRKHNSRYIAVALNAWALYVVSTVTDSVRVQAAAPLVAQWRSAMFRGLVQNVKDAQRYGHAFSSFELVARVRLVVGTGALDLQGVSCGGSCSVFQETLSMASLATAAADGSCGEYCKAATALILLRANPSDATADGLLRGGAALPQYCQSAGSLSLVLWMQALISKGAAALNQCRLPGIADTLRSTGRTAHLATSGSPHPLSMEMQSTVLQASLLSASEALPGLLSQKLANYIAQGDGNRWGGGGATDVMRLLALTAYDVAYGSNTPHVELKANVGHSTV